MDIPCEEQSFLRLLLWLYHLGRLERSCEVAGKKLKRGMAVKMEEREENNTIHYSFA